MRFASPYALLLLLGAIPLILILHSLRPRGVRVKTTALFLWERVLRERPIGTRLGRLFRKNLLLIFQILAAIFLVSTLADPRLLGFGSAGGDTIVVLDLSASMKAKGRNGLRFENARREFLRLIDAKAANDKMMVIGAGPRPTILASSTSDKGKLREIARAIQPTDAPAPVKEAVLFAHSFLRPGGGDRVVVISDGAFDGAAELPWNSAHLSLVGVGEGGENIGIVGFELRRAADGTARHEAMVRIKNFTAHPARAPLALAIDGKPWVQETVEIGAGESRARVYSYRGNLPARLEARLDVEDDFTVDNRAYLAVGGASPLRVLYAGKDNPYLERLFRALPNILVTRAASLSQEELSARLKSHDVVVLDGAAPLSLAEGNFILIDTLAKGWPLKSGGKIAGPRLLPSLVKHPLAEGLSFDDLYVREARRLVVNDGVTLAASKEGPLIVALERAKLKVLAIGFDLSASDLPWKVAFPVLFSNAFHWFRPRAPEFPGAQVQAGRPYAIQLAPTDQRIEIKSPLGSKEVLRAASNPLLFTGTPTAGFYSYMSGGREGEFAVNLLSEGESDIRPRVALDPEKAAGRGEKSVEKSETASPLWPALLAAAVMLLLFEGYLVFRSGAALYPIAARLLALSIMSAALWNPKLFSPATALDVIVAADFSRSVGAEGKEKALAILEEARGVKGADARAGLLFFGQRPAWEVFPRADIVLADFSPEVGREETNLQAALEAPVAQIGEGRQGRILLISDGNEIRGEALRALPFLRSHGVPVWVLPVSLSGGKNEVYVRELALPQQVDGAETFEIKGAIESRFETQARVRLLRDGVIQREEAVRLRPGANPVGFKDSLAAPGSHTYELWVEAAADTLPENNRLQGIVEVKGQPRALYVYSGEKQHAFANALSAQGYAVVESPPEQSPLALPEIAAFDLVALDNVPAYRLTQAKMEAVERYVRDLGGGLVVIGGPQSYGAGGYYRTPLERILPVEMRPPSRLEMPHIALLFVLDKSGSMGAGAEGATKLDLAKAAALAAADLLNPSDQVGILTFDAAWDWLLPFRAVGKGEWISERLSAIQSDGGTDLYKAMVEAHRSLSAKPAAIKHALVLSDGLTDKADFHALVERMARAGITVSTVAIGQDADLALMRNIARDGKGRGYAAIDPQTVPQIFTTETLLISRDLLIEKPAQPRIVAAVGPLKGFAQQSMPPVLGYVLTHPKPQAELLMKAGDDPLLVSWRYGLGKVIAYTSDLSGRWGRHWIAWQDFPRWAGQVARSAMRATTEHRVKTDIQQEGDEIRAVVDLFSKQGGFINELKLKGNLTAPGQAPAVTAFNQIAPGRYEGRLTASRRGSYLLTLHEERDRTSSTIATLPFIVPYPREYRELNANMALLSRLAEESGGEVLDPERLEQGVKRLFTPDPGKATASRETWQPLSALALFLFLADLAIRRRPTKGPGLKS